MRISGPFRRTLVAAAALFVLGSVAAVPARAASSTAHAPCPQHVSCRTVTVPLDRSGALAGTIALHVGIVRARHERRPPVIAFAGGPGQSSVPFTSIFADDLDTRRAGRDLVTIDTRGTGWSGLVRCTAYEHAFQISEVASAGSCARALGASRAYYTTADVAADIDAVRRRLGYRKVALFGVSYGTHVALEYARRYPQAVERVILDSPLEADGGDPFALATLQAIPRVLHTICTYGCGETKHPVQDMRQLATQLRAHPIRRQVHDGDSLITVDYTADDLYNLLVSTDLFPPLMQIVPPVVSAALQGKAAALIALDRAVRRLDSLGTLRDFSPGLFAATLCEESPVAWDRSAAPAVRRAQAWAALNALPNTSFGPFDRLAALRAGLLPTCETWPAAERPANPDPPLPSMPFLLLSGELDMRTPLEGAERLAGMLPHATLVKQPAVGHDVLGAGPGTCGSNHARAFLRGATAPHCGVVPVKVARVASRRPVIPVAVP
jgi:pimeloyl-ACP methyl ester carboxylesterase